MYKLSTYKIRHFIFPVFRKWIIVPCWPWHALIPLHSTVQSPLKTAPWHADSPPQITVQFSPYEHIPLKSWQADVPLQSIVQWPVNVVQWPEHVKISLHLATHEEPSGHVASMPWQEDGPSQWRLHEDEQTLFSNWQSLVEEHSMTSSMYVISALITDKWYDISCLIHVRL